MQLMKGPLPPLKTSVLLLIFNRPTLTIKAFERIRAARPQKLFIASDGPRRDHPGEIEAVERSRSVVDLVDWDCEVKTLFRHHNLGCGHAVSSAIDWAFEAVDDLIILEDDCLATASFFPYCAELLNRYRDDERIYVISGDNFQDRALRAPYSYYFSRYNHCWGWATWRRAWRYFDLEMTLWPEIRDGGWLVDIFRDDQAAAYWQRNFDAVFSKKIDTWDYQWTFACWAHSALTILPAKNLVENIGFGEGATHTREHPAEIRKAEDLSFPLKHPPFVIRDARADDVTQQKHFGVKREMGLLRRVKGLLFTANS